MNNQYLSNGKEIWEFVVSREMYDEVIKKMEEQLSINHVEVSTYIPLFKSNLNNKELQVLQKAFENGFF